MPEKVVEKNGSERDASNSRKTEVVPAPPQAGSTSISSVQTDAMEKRRSLLPNLSILTIERVTSVTSSVIDITGRFESVSLALCLRGRDGYAVA